MTIFTGTESKKGGHPASWYQFLIIVTMVFTAFELVLVNRKKGIFTGGFLASSITEADQTALLILALYLSNLLIVLCTFIPAQVIATKWKWQSAISLSMVLFSAFMPLLLMDIICYEVTRFLGDNISFSLLSKIAGGSVADMIAHISMNHWLLLLAMLSLVFTGIFIGSTIWLKLSFSSAKSLETSILLGSFGLIVAVGILLVAISSQKTELMNKSIQRFPATRSVQFVLNQITDLDRDGSSLFSIPPDPNHNDARIYPYAPDIPGNGLDENGLFGDLQPETNDPYSDDGTPPIFTQTPHLVLLVMESFRSDLLFKRLKNNEVTPNMNRLAKEGAYTLNGSSHNGYSIGSLNAIFRGSLHTNQNANSLIDDFNANGYTTACFSAENEAFGDIESTTGLNRADHFYDARQDVEKRAFPFSSAGSLIIPAEVVLGRLDRFLTERGSDAGPLFLYVNLQDLHFPYHHWAMQPLLIPEPLPRSEISPQNRKKLEWTYLNAAANVDAAVGRLLALLRSKLDSQFGILILADHGESLFDGGFLGHGHHLTDIQMQIPIIAHGFPATLEAPMGQVEIRTVIRQALSQPSSDRDPNPKVVVKPGKKIFRYIGSLTRPSRIAWFGQEGQLSMDLRRFSWRTNEGEWQPLQEASEGVRRDLKALVNHWELLQLKQIGHN